MDKESKKMIEEKIKIDACLDAFYSQASSALIGTGKKDAPESQNVALEWNCWILSEGDIRRAAKQHGINPNAITKKQLHNIAGIFKDAIAWVCDDWMLWLEMAIKIELKMQDAQSY